MVDNLCIIKYFFYRGRIRDLPDEKIFTLDTAGDADGKY